MSNWEEMKEIFFCDCLYTQPRLSFLLVIADKRKSLKIKIRIKYFSTINKIILLCFQMSYKELLPHQPGVVVHAFKALGRVGRSLSVRGQPHLPSEFQDSQGYRETLSPKKEKQELFYSGLSVKFYVTGYELQNSKAVSQAMGTPSQVGVGGHRIKSGYKTDRKKMMIQMS